MSDLPPQIQTLAADRLTLIINDIRNLAEGNIMSGRPDATMLAAAAHYRNLQRVGFAALVVAVVPVVQTASFDTPPRGTLQTAS